jgi:Sulfatase
MLEKTKNKIQQFNIQKASFLIIILPYLGANILGLSQSPFFSVINLVLLLLALLAIDIITSWAIERISQKYNSIQAEKILSIILVTITIEFFYGFTLNIPLHKITQTLFSTELREKVLLLIALILLVGLQIAFLRKKLSYKGMNIFLIILTVIALGSSVSKRPSGAVPINSIVNNYQIIKSNHQGTDKNKIENGIKDIAATKPVILIIVDEYNSPDNLFQLTKDSSVYSFNQWLQQKGWKTNTNAYSYELSTIHSMSSMFNFNLSRDRNNDIKTNSYSKQNEEKIVLSKLFHATLADSLTNKGVSIYNYGIFDFGKTQYKSRLYLYPRNFVEAFLLHSSYLAEKTKTGSFQAKYVKNPPSYISDHNKDLLENLPRHLEQEQINNKAFVYVHLYMPHNPFSLEPEFKNPETDNFKRYLAYWNFTNKKLETLLSKLTKENKYRIILTGDHGLRGTITNAHASFSAYFGFENFELEKVKSVQDNGSLINSSF